MPKTPKGIPVQEWFDEEEARSPGFIAAIDAEAGKLALAKRLKELREKAELSQAELAAKVGTQQPGIARLERGESMPSLDLVYKVASACGYLVLVEFKAMPKRMRPKAAKK